MEKRVWNAVRSRQLGGYKLRRQATIDPFIVDFLCAEHRLVIELDGGQHGSPQDTARTRELERRGYRVIRFANQEVAENLEGVLTVILSDLDGSKALAAPPPSPNPLPPAGEG